MHIDSAALRVSAGMNMHADSAALHLCRGLRPIIQEKDSTLSVQALTVTVFSLNGTAHALRAKKAPSPRLFVLKNGTYKCTARGSNPGHPD